MRRRLTIIGGSLAFVLVSLLLYPAIEASVYERVVIQNHPISFATVDLRRPPAAIRNELRALLRDPANIAA